MDVSSEQHAVIKFCVRLNKSGAEKVNLLCQAYQDECLGRSMILQWHHTFVERRDSAAPTPHGGRPSTATSLINVNTVSNVIEEDRHLSTRKIVELLNMTQSSIHRILHQHLQMQRVSTMWVPHLLTCEQMDTHLHLREEVFEWIAEDSDYLDQVIMVDESWVHHHDPLSRQEKSALETEK